MCPTAALLEAVAIEITDNNIPDIIGIAIKPCLPQDFEGGKNYY